MRRRGLISGRRGAALPGWVSWRGGKLWRLVSWGDSVRSRFGFCVFFVRCILCRYHAYTVFCVYIYRHVLYRYIYTSLMHNISLSTHIWFQSLPRATNSKLSKHWGYIPESAMCPTVPLGPRGPEWWTSEEKRVGTWWDLHWRTVLFYVRNS